MILISTRRARTTCTACATTTITACDNTTSALSEEDRDLPFGMVACTLLTDNWLIGVFDWAQGLKTVTTILALVFVERHIFSYMSK
jgi:hypothetical protein